MFKLKFKITDEDMKAVNKSVMWMYFIPYLVVSLLGIGAGIAATVLHLRTELLVLGCILIGLGAILLVLSVLLLITPKNFVASALITSEEHEREFIIDKTGITVKTDNQSDIYISYAEFTKLKNKTDYIIGYLGKEQVIIIKDAITEGGSLSELYDYLTGMIKSAHESAADMSDAVKSSAEPVPEETADSSEEKTEATAEEAEEALEKTEETADAAAAETEQAEGDGNVETTAGSEEESAVENSQEETDAKEETGAKGAQEKKTAARKKSSAKSGRAKKSDTAE